MSINFDFYPFLIDSIINLPIHSSLADAGLKIS